MSIVSTIIEVVKTIVDIVKNSKNSLYITTIFYDGGFYVYLFSARLNSFKHPTFTSLHYWITFQNKLL